MTINFYFLQDILLKKCSFVIMKIYTKTGDKGQTSLIGGTRVSKTELRI